MRKTVGAITLIGISGIVGTLVSLCAYLSKFNGKLSNEHEVWAQFADYLSGTIGVVLTFVSFIALLYTIYIQSKELSETRQEMKLSRQAQERAVDFTRIEALLSLKAHYLDTINKEYEKAEWWGKDRDDSFILAVRNAIADYDTKLREVTRELNEYHNKLVQK